MDNIISSFSALLRTCLCNMGCCFSCKEENSSNEGEINERTHLLVDPVSNNTTIQRVNSDDFLNRYPNSVPKKTDEQSALNRILQETATNVIDVAAMDSHTLEQHDYMDRIRLYNQRMMQAWNNIQISPVGPHCLLIDISAPEKVLGTNPISAADQQLINDASDKALAAMKKIFVQHKEDLVVPFGIP
ncbi:ragulator complex protein LAMTOR1-like [Ctenocephalides felis]|uniref:ragulator complex protein LAMTOR1-like n=1 Tax=Ctenocephalides felis TaxID=7515 RepID=UPI000E6E40DA|nr:ragulator complex protein LAMTOR1-like [Ctenocephalides felis]